MTDQQRRFLEGTKLCAQIRDTPDWDEHVAYHEFRTVLEFERRGQAKASELALSVLRAALVKARARANRAVPFSWRGHTVAPLSRHDHR